MTGFEASILKQNLLKTGIVLTWIKDKMLKLTNKARQLKKYLFPRRMDWVKTSNKMQQHMLTKRTVKLKMRVKHCSIVSKQRWMLELRQIGRASCRERV